MTPLVYFYCLYVSAKTSVITLALALLLSIMMVLASVSALAAPDQQVAGTPAAQEGSITVHPSTTVPLAGKTLNAYRILDASYGSTGTLGGTPAQAVAYTIPAAMAGFYNEYFAQAANTTAGVEAKTVAELAAAAHKTVDQYVADRIHDLSTADLKTFEYAALAYAKDTSKGNLTPVAGTYNESTKDVNFTNLPAGYYLIEDIGTPTPLSAVMLDTVTNAKVEITLKASDETEKEILTVDELVNRKANELGLGRAVNYKVTQKIPDTTGYDYYYYMINDTLSDGLTFNPDSVVVKVGGTELTKNSDYYLYYLGDTHNTTDAMLNGKTFIVAFKDIVTDIADATKTYFVKDAAVEITYSATVNANAVNGVDPNTNTASVQYSNNPDKDGKGDWDTDHPGIPANDGNHPTGVGPDKKTVTYTDKIKVIKVDGSNNNAPLEGVEFTLTGTAKDAVFNAEEVFEIDPAGSYWLLNDGTYTTKEPQTAPTVTKTTGPAGWVEISAADAATATAAGKAVRKVGEKYYRPYVEATDSALDRYIINESNAGDYASTTTKYNKVTKTSNAAENYNVVRSGVTAGTTEASVSFEELGAGTYKLTETGVLAGYNGLPEIDFTLACTLPQDKDGTTLKNFTGSEKATWTLNCTTAGYESAFTQQEDGTFVITLTNNTGTELPSTGGIGTTIFYVAGSILVLAAAILLITKRRMGAED